MITSDVQVAFGRRFLAGLTPRTVREICGFGKVSGRGSRRFYGLNRSLVRMLSATTGSGNNRLVFIT